MYEITKRTMVFLKMEEGHVPKRYKEGMQVPDEVVENNMKQFSGRVIKVSVDEPETEEVVVVDEIEQILEEKPKPKKKAKKKKKKVGKK